MFLLELPGDAGKLYVYDIEGDLDERPFCNAIHFITK